jgi:hypothetical protein
MFMKRGIRLGVGALAIATALLVAAPAFATAQTGSFKLGSPTSGEPGYPTCKVPTHVTNKCSISVVVKDAPANTAIAIDECNANAANNDDNACSQTPGSKPGEVDIVETNSKGKATVKDYPVLVSSKTEQGDGYCAKGDTCYIVVGVISNSAAIGTLQEGEFTAG